MLPPLGSLSAVLITCTGSSDTGLKSVQDTRLLETMCKYSLVLFLTEICEMSSVTSFLTVLRSLLFFSYKICCCSYSSVAFFLTTSIISVAPASVKVFGADKIVQGDNLVVECESAPSNPPTSLAWWLHQESGTTSSLQGQSFFEAQPDGSTVTRSLLSVPVKDVVVSQHHLVVECTGQHPLLGADSLVYAHNVDILCPPGVPQIAGPEAGAAVEAGRPQRLTCYSAAGHPPAQLQWYRGNQMMESQYR